jgi:DNA-binding FrmR family transcriptional regulator
MSYRGEPIDREEVGTPLTTFFSNILPSSPSSSSAKPASEPKANQNEPTELLILKEVVPDLHSSVLLEILRGNSFDLEKSIDAALALNTSLSYEKGTTAVLGTMDSVNGHANNTDKNASMKRRSSTGSLPSSSKPKERPASLGNTKLNSSNQVSGQNTPRGVALLLDMKFLVCPRYRLSIDRHKRSLTNFTIHFSKHKAKIGITIREFDGEILIHQLHSSLDGVACLAQDAGVRVGDIITGINGEYFSPGVEVQDVIDILELTGRYVSIHFCRHRGVDDSPYHRCAQMLLDQGVIKAERALYVSKILYRLKERIVHWNSGWIAQRIEQWSLHRSAQSIAVEAATASSSSTASSFFSSMMLPSSNPSSSYNTSAGMNLASDMSDTSPLTRRLSSKSIWDINTILNPKPVDEAINTTQPLGSQAHSNDLASATKSLRPALSLRVLRAEERQDHVVYIIWVLDVKSGAEWYVKRRFREFHEFRDQLLAIRPSLAQVDFPPKRLSVEGSAYVFERLNLLQKFMRRISSIAALNTFHPSTARLQLLLQQFLDVSEHHYAITVLEKRPITSFSKNMVQAYLQSVLQLSVMDKVLTSFIDNFYEDANEDEKLGLNDWNPMIGRAIIKSVKEYIDNLQNVLYDGLYEDCIDILRQIEQDRNIVSASATALLEDEMRQVIRSAIRKQVEVEIYIPCAARLSKVLELSFNSLEIKLRHKLQVLLNHEQHFFGIALNHVSPSNWEDIVSMLRQLRLKTLPHDRLESLIEAAKEVPRLFSKEHVYSSDDPSQQQQQSLGADEFLPIFIYILVHAEIPDLFALNEELQMLCDPEKRLSETGYYLATLEASIQHLMEFDESDGVEYFFHSKRPSAAPYIQGSSDSEDIGLSSRPEEAASSVDLSMTMTPQRLATAQALDQHSSMDILSFMANTMTDIARIRSADSNDSSTVYGDTDNLMDSSEF